MRRLLLLAACAAATAGCVSVEGLPDPHGALKSEQRLVVNVYPSPGPWIIGSADSKAEAAAKITPLGFFVQTAEDEHTLRVSKNLQQYLPRPRLGAAVQDALLKALKIGRSTGTVQTGLEAGIPAAQLAEWNKSKNQLDWRQRYYAPDPELPAPRDYAKLLNLDDAVILDVNVSFGTEATEDDRLLPTMSAAVRAYRGDTSHLLWEHEDIVSDQTSSATLTDYQVQPWTLTDGLQRLAPVLGNTVAASFFKAFNMPLSSSTLQGPNAHYGAQAAAINAANGLVPMSLLMGLSDSTSTVSISTIAAPATTSAPVSTTTAALPPLPGMADLALAPTISTQTVAVSTPIAAVPDISLSTPTVSVSTPAVSISSPFVVSPSTP